MFSHFDKIRVWKEKPLKGKKKMSKVRRFRITGMDNGYPIEPYIVETDYKGNIDIHLSAHGDSVRYYEELSDSQSKKKELEKIPMPQISLFDYYKNKKKEKKNEKRTTKI